MFVPLVPRDLTRSNILRTNVQVITKQCFIMMLVKCNVGDYYLDILDITAAASNCININKSPPRLALVKHQVGA